jgi:hypothetical protein
MITQAEMTQQSIDEKNAAWREYEYISRRLKKLFKEIYPEYLSCLKSSIDHFRRYVVAEGSMADIEFRGGTIVVQIGAIRQTSLLRNRIKMLEHMYRRLSE